MTVYEIPLSPPQTLKTILGAKVYTLRFHYATTTDVDGGWFLDIGDANGNPLVCGIALVTGLDLLEPYGYLGFTGKLFVATDGDPGTVPTFANLGVQSHVYFEPN